MKVDIIQEQDCQLYHTLTQDCRKLLLQSTYLPPTETARKLTFTHFVQLLLYFYVAGLDSLRSLITDLNTKPISNIGLATVGLSTLHDAFWRYPARLFQQLYQTLLEKGMGCQLEEFKELGHVALIDGSLFPISISACWAEYKKSACAVKLHLSFSLNQLLPRCFLITAANHDERVALIQMLVAGVTYIADRGYQSFELFQQIQVQSAHFVIRLRKRLKYNVLQSLPVELIPAVKRIFLEVTDELVQFQADKYHRQYRRIQFKTRKTTFILLTDRFDLTTFEIIRLYAFRWQVELFFRYFKRTLHAIHLLHQSENGLTIQFYVVMIVHLLVLRYKQQQLQLCLFKKSTPTKTSPTLVFGSTEDFIENLGQAIPSNFKIDKQEWNSIKNCLFEFVQLKFNFL